MARERHCSHCGGQLPADAPQGLCPQCLMKLGLPTGSEGDEAACPDTPADAPTSAAPPGGFIPPEPAELAEQFPQLEILELLGQGGMGAVYKARQKQLDRLVALKILPPQVGQDPAFAERFTREARSLAKLGHSHVVTVHDFGETEAGLYYFIMEFVDGTDLRRVIQTGNLSPSEALAIVPQICEALQYAHDEGVVHRDIKPENILLDKKGRVKIADFGLAKLLGRPATTYTLTRAGHRMGTPHYMAPEQIEHPGQVDHRADIYSLGVVFYEMLTGQLPIGRFPPPSQKVQVDVRLDRVVLKSLEHEPERRYQHASEVKTDVETITSQGQPPITLSKRAETEVICQQVKRPAIGLLATGIVNWIGITLGVLILTPILAKKLQATAYPEALLWVIALIAILASGLIIFAALKMMRLEAYRWAITGSILAMIITPGNIIGLPIGIWALVVLTGREVKAAFPSKSKEQIVKTKRPGTLFGIGMQEHLKLVAIIRIAFGILSLLFGGRKAMAILPMFGAAPGTFALVLSVLDIVGGVGLLKRKPWARILVLILGVLDLALIPIGPVIGIYTIYILMREETVQFFRRTRTGKKREQGPGEVKTDVETLPDVAVPAKSPVAELRLPTVQVETSGTAIASLVLGISGIFTAGLGAIVGIILGIIALRAIRRGAGRIKGRGLAIAGILVSGMVLFMIVFLFGPAMILPALWRARTAARTAESMANARQIAIVIATYGEENDGRLPPADSWPDALEPYIGKEREILSSPFNPDAGRAWAMNSNLQTLDIPRADKTVLFFEAEFGSPPAGGPELLPQEPRWKEGYIIGFADYHAEYVPLERLDELIWEP